MRTTEDFVPADRYRGPDVAQRERELLWPRVWQLACREQEIPKVGDFVAYEILGESIIIVRTSSSSIKAFYNVCQHRGRRLVDQPSGELRGFYCKYHGWKYELDGRCSYVHHREQWAACGGLNDRDLDLKGVRVDLWGGWVWINMDPQAQSLADWLGPTLRATLEPFELASMHRAFHEVLIAPVNWKVVVEAFSEGYHAGATHNQWVDYRAMQSPAKVHGLHTMYFTQFAGMPRVRREDGSWSETRSLAEMLYYQSKELHDTLHALVPETLMAAAARLRDTTPPDAAPEAVFTRLLELQKEEVQASGAAWPQHLGLAELGAAGTGWHVFPNTIFLPSPDGLLWYRVRPHGDDPQRSIFDIWVLRRYAPGKEPEVEPHVSDGFEAFRGRNPFLEQDFSNMLAVDRGMRSRGWAGARTNPVEELPVAHFHAMLDQYTQVR
jgi:phenylpropionate dioxygenase-like ring-hydroxylating dioxygenase large terminal subunit